MRKILVILTIFFLLPLVTMGQVVYPIRTITNIVPPAPYTLDGFASEPGRLNVNIMVDDITISQYPVKLRMHIEGNGIRLTTTPGYQPQPIYLDGGVTLQLTGPDLEGLLDPNNITFQGYSINEYKRNGRLPEGVYRISFEVLDYYRGFSVSSAIPGIAMLSLANTPILTFPANKSEIDIDVASQIRFSWMGTFTAIAGANIEYRFRLWQVRPESRDPYEVVKISAPVYEETIAQTALIYDGGMPALLTGNTYAWQVTAIDQTGQVIFKNNGESEVFTFRYGQLCIVPDAIISKVGYNTATIKWQNNPAAINYRVSYREKSDTQWTDILVQLPECTIENLSERTDYEVQVTALCASEESAPSRLLSFKTNRNVNYACGAATTPVVFTNNEPLGSLRPFDEFKASDFYITVLKAEGINGVFSGSGVISFPYLEMIQFQVEFRNITINTDYQMTAGEVVFVYNEKSSLIASVGGGGETGSLEEIPFSLDNAINQLTDNSVVYDSNVTDISVSGNTVKVTLENGTTQTIAFKDGETVGIITPDTGYVVDTSSGQVFEIPNKPPGSAKNVLPPSQTNSYDCITSFKPAANHRFGFDQVGDGTTKPNQYFLKDKTGNNIHWKSLEAGSNDYLIVTASGNCPTDSLRFIRETGIASGVSKQGGSNALNLLVAGGMDGTEEILSVARATTVMVNDTTGHEILTETGALGLVSYIRMHKTVVLIPVNTATLPYNTTVIQQRLNDLYAPAIVEWTVKTDQRLEVSRIEEGDFKTTGLSMASKYTGDMRKVINAYEKTQKAEANTVYLFFMNVAGADLNGFMPLTGEYGFIFNYNNNPDLLAHELSHGTFNLRHTFSDKAQYHFNKGATKNLLDYSNSTELWKYQWDLIHNPEKILFAWGQSEEEGAMMDLNMSKESIMGVINLIRERNIAKEKTADLSIFSLSKGGSVNLKLTDNFTLEYVEVNIESGKYIGNQDNPFLLEPLTIKPMELKSANVANPPIQGEDFVQISFNRFDQPAPPHMGIVESDSVGISFTVKLAQKDEFEAYLLFATWENLMRKNELTASEIAIVRRGIAQVQDETEKGDLYEELQTKVIYRNQRDNISTSEGATINNMCNLTSVAMAFEMLGVSKVDFIDKAETDNITISQNIKDGDFEDLLEYVRLKKKWGSRTRANTWDNLAELVGVQTHDIKNVKSSLKRNQPIDDLKQYIRAGYGVVMSLSNYKGHIVRLQKISETGVTIDDPFGELYNLAKREFKLVNNSGSYYTNEQNISDSGKKGEDNEITWNEFDVTKLEGISGNEEIQANQIVNQENLQTFEEWLQSRGERCTISEFLTREEVVENENSQPSTETVKYYITKGTTIKFYKIYSVEE